MVETLLPDEALVEIQPLDGTAVNITTDVDSFEESGFEREIEYRPFFGGAKVAIQKQQSEGEISMNIRVTRALMDQVFWGGTGTEFTSGGAQTPYRIAFLVTKDSSITSASEALSAGTGSDHYRKVYAEAYLTSWNPTLEVEGMLEGTATFMVAPTDGNGDANILVQIGSDAQDALGNYVTGTKWA